MLRAHESGGLLDRLRHAELAGLPVDSISEVALEISPSMFV